MAKKKTEPEVTPHTHSEHSHKEVASHEHEHRHEQVAAHSHEPEEPMEHGHAQYPPMPHTHQDLRGDLRGAVRSLLTVIEAGGINTAQVKAIHAVRVILGDAHGTGCPHENTVYETGDRLICQDCREDITPDG